ncbi:glycosyltransferase family 4 protein [Xanthobacter sp. KR7-65]|uniref:glycosyltransferase family 4 protein n=1 Tax=Xanthobacter sp. KR7-65 TaxID=3156612 RepID=UPI0032B4F98E
MSAGGPAVALVHPGDIATPSGGYAYDRRILDGLSALGFAIRPLRLDGGFPLPSQSEIAAALATLAAAPPGTVLLADGLALGALPAEGLKALGRPIVALVHHPLALERGLDAATADRLLASERGALSVAKAVIAVSPETRRMLVTRYGVPAERITLALPGTAPAPRAAADGIPARLIAVGSLTPRKGYDILLDALDSLADLDWSLTIVGSPAFDPPTAAAVARRAAGFDGRIRLAGALDTAALDAAYGAADILVHPSLYEGYGMALAEALKRGLPIVATTGGAAGETVPDGAGLKVPPGDAPALAAALRTLLIAPHLRRRMADAAFAAGTALPDWPQTCATIGRVLSAVRP